ncbi:hypothetical protein LJB42_000739 [Komagataella kurtzmanii]|nr:hypothetical protein LJB42_000739 [Komagataella kurtzmanii]
MVNHIYKESLRSVIDIGIDRGANNVKKARFLQFERVKEEIQRHIDEKELEVFKDQHIRDTDNIKTGELKYKDDIQIRLVIYLPA